MKNGSKMPNITEIMLQNLVAQWRKEAKRIRNIARIESENAGHSNTPEGTGDEGWRKNIEDFATADGFDRCANSLESLIKRGRFEKT